jgi:hypothetical protein
MRSAVVAFGVASAIAGSVVAHADSGPNFVVPGRPNIPIVINGINASYGVAQSDFGLYRPGAVPVVIYPSPYAAPLIPVPPVRYRPPKAYYPSLGGKPYQLGRLEIEPPADRPLPKPAQGFSRSWSAESPDVPPTQYAPSPPMMISPEVNFNEPGRRPLPPRRR